MESKYREQIQEYVDLCQSLIREMREKHEVEIDSAEFMRDHSEKYMELAEDSQIYLQRIAEYLELRQRAVNEFISQLFWVKQALSAKDPEETSFYLRNALEGLIDMETLLRRETELLVNFEERVQAIRNFIDLVDKTKKEIESYQKFYPKLILKLEEIVETIQKQRAKHSEHEKK
ncbi:MAG: hypothetical protein ACTSUQ_13230 [Candidatus Freyarchaeota archaeon]